MKGLKSLIIIAVSGLLAFSSCINDFLDRKPLDVISDDDVWANESAIQAYMAGMYEKMFVEPHGWLLNWGTLGHYTDESMRSYSWGHPYTPTFPDSFMSDFDGSGDFWSTSYKNIRIVNEFFQKLPTSSVSEDLKKRYEAEAHFIRAFYYFGLAKRFGGVPLLKEVQEYSGGNIEELKIPRNTEEETWNFIGDECDLAMKDLPESYPATDQFRATKYAAAALKSRAMLYAGSISKYGSVQLNGLVGISADKADDFFEKSFAASEIIIGSKKFDLYEKNDDKATNYQNLFLDKTLHEEAIYVKAYSVPDK